MDLMQHALNVAGLDGRLTLDKVIELAAPGRTIIQVDWRGCMATIRRETDVGVIIGWQTTPKEWSMNQNEWFLKVRYLKHPGIQLVHTSRLRFVGKNFKVEEWI